MSDQTPRTTGAFPNTPYTTRRRTVTPNGASPSPRRSVVTPLPTLPTQPEYAPSGPLIPSHIIDAPTQRLYVFAIYIGLLAWRLYDFYTLAVDEVESLWLFMKWIMMDGVFVFCLPLLQIPWLEWSNAVAVGIFLLHAALDAMLMFRIGVCMPKL